MSERIRNLFNESKIKLDRLIYRPPEIVGDKAVVVERSEYFGKSPRDIRIYFMVDIKGIGSGFDKSFFDFSSDNPLNVGDEVRLVVQTKTPFGVSIQGQQPFGAMAEFTGQEYGIKDPHMTIHFRKAIWPVSRGNFDPDDHELQMILRKNHFIPDFQPEFTRKFVAPLLKKQIQEDMALKNL